MTSLRLLLAQNTADNRWSGMGRWAHETAAALRRRDHQVELWFADAFPARVTGGRAGVVRYPRALGERIVAARERFDAVIVHEPAGRWYGRARRRDKGLPPLILMCHNVEEHVFDQLRAAHRLGCARVPFGTRVRTPLFRLPQSRGAIRSADHVVCLSRLDREYLLRRHRLPPERVTHLVNGAPEPVTRVEPAPPLSVLVVGGWLDVKGRGLLPRLWALVASRHPETRLTIAGAGAPTGEVLADFPPRQREHVTVLARVTHATGMADLMRTHHVLLVPSISEGSPLTVLEAMAFGLPIAAAAVGGIPDMVRDRREGSLFTPCDAMAAARSVGRLLDNRALARALARAAQQRARRFTWDAVAATFERIAKDLVS